MGARLKDILPDLALYVHARRSGVIMDFLEDEGRTMPPPLGQAATLAYIDRLDNFLDIGIRAAELGIHPAAVITDPELLPLCFRDNDRLLPMGSAPIPAQLANRAVVVSELKGQGRLRSCARKVLGAPAKLDYLRS